MAYEQTEHAGFTSTRLDSGAVYSFNQSVKSDRRGGAYFGAGIGLDITSEFNLSVMFNRYDFSNPDDDVYIDTGNLGAAKATTLGLELVF